MPDFGPARDAVLLAIATGLQNDTIMTFAQIGLSIGCVIVLLTQGWKIARGFIR